MKKLIAILLFPLFLAGCNTNVIPSSLVKQIVSAPEVKGIKLKSFSVEDQSVVFDVSVYNPNIYPLPISGLSGDFKLNQISVGSMSAKTDSSLAAQKTQTVTLPIKLSTDAFKKAAKAAIMNRETNYSFNGAIDTSIGQVPVSKTGSVSAAALLSALVR
jgi:LEA14-like dessication related protein